MMNTDANLEVVVEEEEKLKVVGLDNNDSTSPKAKDENLKGGDANESASDPSHEEPEYILCKACYDKDQYPKEDAAENLTNNYEGNNTITNGANAA